MTVRNGVDVLRENPSEFIEDAKIGLITNPTGVTLGLYSTLDAFHEHPGIDLAAVFGPEHGARGIPRTPSPWSPGWTRRRASRCTASTGR